MARLAYTIRKDAKFPVLISIRASRVPAVEELDDFCLQAGEIGANATLLICDANAPISRYGDLLRGFVSRGRRVVIVGSTYRIVDDVPTAKHLLEVPAELDRAEVTALTQLVARWSDMMLGTSPSRSRYLLTAVYRILPHVRPRLASGLAREAQVVEDDLRVRGTRKSPTIPKPTTALGEALANAGLIDPKTLLNRSWRSSLDQSVMRHRRLLIS